MRNESNLCVDSVGVRQWQENRSGCCWVEANDFVMRSPNRKPDLGNVLGCGILPRMRHPLLNTVLYQLSLAPYSID